jgi:hypothetical protein
MKLIDCTFYANKPKGGIPGTEPGVYSDRAWRPTEKAAHTSDRKKTKAWAASIPHKRPVMVDLEPMLMAGGGLGDIMELLGDIRDTRKDLTVYVYVGGRLWPHIDAKVWHPKAGGSHPQVLRAQCLIGEMHRIGLCDGLAAEAYPPALVAHVNRTPVLNEPLIRRYMTLFFSNIREELEPFLPHCPIIPTLAPHFASGGSTVPMPASLFRAVRDECASRFDVALLWGGIDFNEDGTQKRVRNYAENADFFEDAKPAATPAPELKLAGQ